MKPGSFIWSCLGAFALVAAFVAFAMLGAESEPEEPNRPDAADACKESVKDRLKAPSTAEWIDVQTVENDGEASVALELDAKNPMGVPMRSFWTCRAVYGNEIWSVIEIQKVER